MAEEDNKLIFESILVNLDISDYEYILSPGMIAKFPLERRDRSKLLIYRNGEIEQDRFMNLERYTGSGSTLVFNNSRVIQARLEFYKDSGAKIEVFCLEPYDPPDLEIAFQSRQSVLWKCLIGNRKKWKKGDLSIKGRIGNHEFTLSASLKGEIPEGAIVKFDWRGSGLTFGEILESTGITPVPPYLKRKAQPVDRIRYQTIYSKENGSVAAPTAGLHFSEEVLSRLKKRGLCFTEITLHTGIGTFRPIQSDSLSDHKMHTECFFISRNTLEKLLEKRHPVISVGTTSLRTLESIYWMAHTIYRKKNPGPDELRINQWDGMINKPVLSFPEALELLLDYMHRGRTERLGSMTRLMIIPGYKFNTTQALLTNFHMPRSSLLLLVAAFIGPGWKRVYRYAVENNFRLLSYGDSSLLFRE
ncbi:MAG: S-adenosylmethionine:tRNA ribosyltransferase-isomerase [Bacteroidales bacterium]|nr:MAG: S-adenosylmethionine:tRNA ribosyltransferase-isomerase [Bacteroidales bacterium]